MPPITWQSECMDGQTTGMLTKRHKDMWSRNFVQGCILRLLITNVSFALLFTGSCPQLLRRWGQPTPIRHHHLPRWRRMLPDQSRAPSRWGEKNASSIVQKFIQPQSLFQGRGIHYKTYTYSLYPQEGCSKEVYSSNIFKKFNSIRSLITSICTQITAQV